MATIQISEDLDRRLTAAAERFGKSKITLISEAIQARFDELQAQKQVRKHIEDVR